MEFLLSILNILCEVRSNVCHWCLLPSVLADNLKSNPGIKWQYFSSEEGIFTVFPAHKFHCKGSYEHRSRYSSTAPLIFIFSQSVVLKTLVKPSVVYTTVTYSLTSSWCSLPPPPPPISPPTILCLLLWGGPEGHIDGMLPSLTMTLLASGSNVVF